MRSRYASGSDSASATAFRLTGWSPPWSPSWISSRTPYSAFVVKIIRGKAYQRGRSCPGVGSAYGAVVVHDVEEELAVGLVAGHQAVADLRAHAARAVLVDRREAGA